MTTVPVVPVSDGVSVGWEMDELRARISAGIAHLAEAKVERTAGNGVGHADVLLDLVRDSIPAGGPKDSDRKAGDDWHFARVHDHVAEARKVLPASTSSGDADKCLDLSQAELTRALMHALYVTFLREARGDGKHPGHAFAIDDYCEAWGLTDAQIDEIWLWIRHDSAQQEVNGHLAVDADARVVYRKAKTPWGTAFCALTPLLAAAVTYVLLVGLFKLLDQVGVVNWPGKDSWWGIAALLIFVILGAALHLGSQFVNINYDDPIKVYDAGGIVDWLALRWVGVIRAYIPIAAVTAIAWGTGQVPHSFQELGTALLAGYTADSVFGAAVSKMKSSAQQSTAKSS